MKLYKIRKHKNENRFYFSLLFEVHSFIFNLLKHFLCYSFQMVFDWSKEKVKTEFKFRYAKQICFSFWNVSKYKANGSNYYNLYLWVFNLIWFCSPEKIVYLDGKLESRNRDMVDFLAIFFDAVHTYKNL